MRRGQTMTDWKPGIWDGSRAAWAKDEVPACPICKGSGQHVQAAGGGLIGCSISPCWICGGTGRFGFTQKMAEELAEALGGPSEPEIPFVPSVVTCFNCGCTARNNESEPLRAECGNCGQVHVAAFGSTQKWIPSYETHEKKGPSTMRFVDKDTGEPATAEQMAELFGEMGMHSPFDPEDGREEPQPTPKPAPTGSGWYDVQAILGKHITVPFEIETPEPGKVLVRPQRSGHEPYVRDGVRKAAADLPVTLGVYAAEARPRPTEQPPKPYDDAEGLPPLADGSRWEDCRIVDSTGSVISIRPLSSASIYPELDGSFVLSCSAIDGNGDVPFLADARHLLARHDRANGCYLPDLLLALAGELNDEADEQEADAEATGMHGRDYLAARDAAHRLLAILDELHEKGIC